MRTVTSGLFLLLALTGCSRGAPPIPAASVLSPATSTATVGGATLQTSTLRLSALNPATAKRYGIDQAREGVLLLVTVRDADGNALDPGDLRLTVTAGVLPDPPQPLELRAIQTDGMTDHIGVIHAKPPASVQFKLDAIRNGARTEVATSVELIPDDAR